MGTMVWFKSILKKLELSRLELSPVIYTVEQNAIIISARWLTASDMGIVNDKTGRGKDLILDSDLGPCENELEHT